MRVPSRGWQQLLIMEGDSTKPAKAAAPAKENGNHALCAVTARSTCAHGPLDADACVQNDPRNRQQLLVTRQYFSQSERAFACRMARPPCLCSQHGADAVPQAFFSLRRCPAQAPSGCSSLEVTVPSL